MSHEKASPPPPPNAFVWVVGYWNADEDSHLFSECRTIDFEDKDKREMIKNTIAAIMFTRHLHVPNTLPR